MQSGDGDRTPVLLVARVHRESEESEHVRERLVVEHARDLPLTQHAVVQSQLDVVPPRKLREYVAQACVPEDQPTPSPPEIVVDVDTAPNAHSAGGVHLAELPGAKQGGSDR